MSSNATNATTAAGIMPKGRAMKEILFRGKRKDNGAWVSGSLVTSVTSYALDKPVRYEIVNKHIGAASDTIEWFEVIPETVGQFTGVFDRNGKRIFEGDIVETHLSDRPSPNDKYDIFKVVAAETKQFPKYKTIYYSPPREITEKVTYEVVGNVIDDAALLETEEW